MARYINVDMIDLIDVTWMEVRPEDLIKRDKRGKEGGRLKCDLEIVSL